MSSPILEQIDPDPFQLYFQRLINVVQLLQHLLSLLLTNIKTFIAFKVAHQLLIKHPELHDLSVLGVYLPVFVHDFSFKVVKCALSPLEDVFGVGRLVHRPLLRKVVGMLQLVVGVALVRMVDVITAVLGPGIRLFSVVVAQVHNV